MPNVTKPWVRLYDVRYRPGAVVRTKGSGYERSQSLKVYASALAGLTTTLRTSGAFVFSRLLLLSADSQIRKYQA